MLEGKIVLYKHTFPKAPAPARMCEKLNCFCVSRINGVSASVKTSV